MRNTPWYHQRRSESAPPAERVKEAPSITQQEQEESVNRISRPTESARYRQSLFWKLDGYMDKGFHSWSKMELFDDCKQCMWTPDGSIKSSCKIRPLNVLPPLSRSGKRGVLSDNNGCKSRTLGSSASGSVCISQTERCESRRAVLRPRPSMERSRTSIVTRTSGPMSSISHRQNAARSFLIRSMGNGRVPAHFNSLKNGGVSGNMAVPRMNENFSARTVNSVAAS